MNPFRGIFKGQGTLGQAIDAMWQANAAPPAYPPIIPAVISDAEAESIARAIVNGGGMFPVAALPCDHASVQKIYNAQHSIEVRQLQEKMEAEARRTAETCCRFCKHWAGFDGIVGEVLGHCRIRAPVVVSSPDGPMTRFPETMGSAVCGEYARRAV